jgi:hypothetical protein
MSAAGIAFGVSVVGGTTWRLDWLYGCVLIVLTVIFHVIALGGLRQKAVTFYGDSGKRRHPQVSFGLVVGATALMATLFHAFEVGVWALAFLMVGAMTSLRSAMLYSLGAMTTYGHTDLFLEDQWRLMGALEALSGWLLFGLTTAFLFWMIQEVSPSHSKG